MPQVLLCNVDKILKPNIEYFLNLGFSESEFFALVKNDPYFILSGLNTKIIPAIQALKETLGCDHQVNLLLKKSTHFFRRGCVPQSLLRNIALLRNYGIPVELIRKRIVLCQPRSSEIPIFLKMQSLELRKRWEFHEILLNSCLEFVYWLALRRRN